MSLDEALDLNGSSIFNVAPVQFQSELSNISALTVCNDVLVVGFRTCKLFRIDLNNPTLIEELVLPFKRSVQELGRIEKLFLDPSGTHLIVTTNKNDNFYIHKKSQSFKSLNELKNVNISSVAWNKHSVNEANSGSLLVGDKSGNVYEAFLEYNESNQKYGKTFQKISYQSSSPIDGLSIDYDTKTNKVTIIIVSGDDITYWNNQIKRKNTKYNDLVLNDVFEDPPVEFEKYQDLGNINGQKFTCNELHIGWLTSSGIVYGNFTQDKIKSKKNISDLKFLVNLGLPESKHKFKSVVLTKYHLLLLRGCELLAINKLNDELVYHQVLPLSDNERFIGISADYKKETYWVFSNLNIYEITIDNEEKDIWKALVENKDYEEALNTTDNVDIKDIIYSKQGDFHFSNSDFINSAKSYANSSRSFESVSLKFLEINQNDALLEYFISKLNILLNDSNKFDFKMQLVMLSSWIVELFIGKLNDIDDSLLTEQTAQLEEKTLLKTSTEKIFQEFLINNKDVLDKDTIYEIITSHNRQSELLYYANLIMDFDFVLAYWIRLENWIEALKVLEKINQPEIVYKHSTVLLVNAPDITVNSWLRFTNLDAAKLLPALLTYNKAAKKVKHSKHQAIRYLTSFLKEFGCKDSTVHDSLLYLLISNESSNDEDTLLTYLEEQGSNFYYNSDFILRLCLRFDKIKSAISIYSSLNFFEDAVNLALDNGLIELAMIITDKPNDDKIRKNLWLKIAKKRTEALRPNDNEKISKEVRFLLDKCELISIKDLLPLLPDFTTIDCLKDEICEDLENFGTLINKLSLEMNQSIQINNNITKDLNTYMEKSQIIKNGESCANCQYLLTTRKFFIFPCNHAFHSDCLIKELSNSNDYGTKKRLEFLQKKYLSKRHGKNDRFVNDVEVDELLCKRCPLCSDLKIDTIDLSITDGKTSQNDWDI